MASKWEPHAAEIEAAFLRGDSYRTISAALLERHGLPLDPAGLHRWWKNKLAKRQAREAAVRKPVVTASAAQAAEAVQQLAVEKTINTTETVETEPKQPEKSKSLTDIIAIANAAAAKGKYL